MILKFYSGIEKMVFLIKQNKIVYCLGNSLKESGRLGYSERLIKFN